MNVTHYRILEANDWIEISTNFGVFLESILGHSEIFFEMWKSQI